MQTYTTKESISFREEKKKNKHLLSVDFSQKKTYFTGKRFLSVRNNRNPRFGVSFVLMLCRDLLSFRREKKKCPAQPSAPPLPGSALGCGSWVGQSEKFQSHKPPEKCESNIEQRGGGATLGGVGAGAQCLALSWGHLRGVGSILVKLVLSDVAGSGEKSYVFEWKTTKQTRTC